MPNTTSPLDEPMLDITPDPVTLSELYDIDPPDGIARNTKFDAAAAEFLQVVDLASTWSKKKAKALVDDFRKTLVEVRSISHQEIEKMEAQQKLKIKPKDGEKKLPTSMLFEIFAEQLILKNSNKDTFRTLLEHGKFSDMH